MAGSGPADGLMKMAKDEAALDAASVPKLPLRDLFDRQRWSSLILALTKVYPLRVLFSILQHVGEKC
jgi:hypothetical protein